MQHADEMNFGDLSRADRELEAALGGLAPAAPSRPRDQWLFNAGMDSARKQFRRRLRMWQSVAAVFALCTTVSILTRPHVGGDAASPGGFAVHVPQRPSPEVIGASVTPPANPYSAISLRDAVLAHGMDGLPPGARDEAASQFPILSPRSQTWQ